MAEIHHYDPDEVIDWAFDADTLTRHVCNGAPCCRLRYGDGEWLSILGTSRRSNCDRHRFYTSTMGAELGRVLEEVRDLHPDNDHIYVGLHKTWHQERIQRWAKEHGLLGKVHFTSNLVLEPGLLTLATLRFVEAVRRSSLDRVLVGNEHLAPVAHGLRAQHVICPERNAYNTIAAIECDCRARCDGKPVIFLVSMGMAAEALIWRLYRHRPDCVLIDTGHVFDAMAGRRTRKHLRRNRGGVMDLINEHYRPLLRLPPLKGD